MKLLLVLFIFSFQLSWGQTTHTENLLVSPAPANLPANLSLDVQYTTKASRPCPVMTTAQRDAIPPAISVGYCITNSDIGAVQFYNGTIWVSSSIITRIEFPIANNITVPTAVTGLSFDSATYNSAKVVCSLARANDTQFRNSSFTLNLFWNGTAWTLSQDSYSYSILDGVTFSISNAGGVGTVQYTSDDMGGVYNVALSNLYYFIDFNL